MERISTEFLYLWRAFEQVLGENGEAELADRMSALFLSPARDTSVHAARSLPVSLALFQAGSLAFHLMNIAEERALLRAYRREEPPGLLPERLNQLKQPGTDDQTLALLQRVRVEPVFTAHPTEAKRATILEHHRELYDLLTETDREALTEEEKRHIRERILEIIDRLWKTGEIYLEKPDVASEVSNILHYATNILPDAIVKLGQRLADSYETASGASLPSEAQPEIRFGSWVGGDRDGHPFVTARVTEETLQRLRLQAFIVIRRQLLRLIDLSLSDHRVQVPDHFINRLKERASSLGESGQAALKRNVGESFRQWVQIMLIRLPLAVARDHATHLEQRPECYTDPAELLDDIAILKDALISAGGQRQVRWLLDPVVQVIRTFRFHLLKLDIRQNSAFYETALLQILQHAGIPAPATADERRLFFDRELSSSRPFFPYDRNHAYSDKPEMAESLATFQVIADWMRRYGPEAIGHLIISMTRDATDLFTVYLLAREVGLLRNDGDGQFFMPVSVVPLFETIDDLKRAPQILEQFLDHPITAQSLRFWNPGGPPAVTIMVGYSDSNKDGGFLASQWSLYRSQQDMIAIAEKRGIAVRFFHGRGGTISRGAGPTHRFVESLPEGSISAAGIRLTEQGETIAQKYGTPLTACYNLEQLVAGALIRLAPRRRPGPPGTILDRLTQSSYERWRSLLDRPAFLQFYAEATPIDAIETNRIGSRPARRTGRRSLADLRAIPWVFSWSQSRFHLTGWFGTGHALAELRQNSPQEWDELQRLSVEADAAGADRAKASPFLIALWSNIENSIAWADPSIMELYSSLVRDKDVRSDVLPLILAEYESTKKELQLLRGDLFPRRKGLHATLQSRSAALHELHRHQVTLLRYWRETDRSNKDIEQVLLLSLSAIAAGLKATG